MTPQVIEINELLDPIDSMIGFILPERLSSKKAESIIQTTLGEQRRKSEHEGVAANKMVNNYFKPNSTSHPMQRFSSQTTSASTSPPAASTKASTSTPAIPPIANPTSPSPPSSPAGRSTPACTNSSPPSSPNWLPR